MTDKTLVLVTAGDQETAERIARTLVEERLAACVNIVPGIRSFYWWEGKVQDDQEFLLLIKTRSECFEFLKERVLALHTYDLPEIIGFTLDRGYAPYLDWIERETEHT